MMGKGELVFFFCSTHVSFENQLFSLKVPKQVLALDVFGTVLFACSTLPYHVELCVVKRPVPKTV